MKKQIVLLCALLSVGQYCSAVPESDVKTAQKVLLHIADKMFITEEGSDRPEGLNQRDSSAWSPSVDTITTYATENSTDIFGNVDEPLASAATKLKQIGDQIITTILKLQSPKTADDINTCVQNISILSAQLSEISGLIGRRHITISKQNAQRELLNTIVTFLRTLAGAKKYSSIYDQKRNFS